MLLVQNRIIFSIYSVTCISYFSEKHHHPSNHLRKLEVPLLHLPCHQVLSIHFYLSNLFFPCYSYYHSLGTQFSICPYFITEEHPIVSILPCVYSELHSVSQCVILFNISMTSLFLSFYSKFVFLLLFTW